jgi:hypothetical protein
VTGKSWQQLKRTCKTKNCFSTPPTGKDYCGPCWKLMGQCRMVPDPQGAQAARDREMADEDAAETKELGA